jgi:hypothetical protein
MLPPEIWTTITTAAIETSQVVFLLDLEAAAVVNLGEKSQLALWIVLVGGASNLQHLCSLVLVLQVVLKHGAASRTAAYRFFIVSFSKHRLLCELGC